MTCWSASKHFGDNQVLEMERFVLINVAMCLAVVAGCSKPPHLLVKKDGIWLSDLQNNEERPFTSDHVLDALAALPVSAWPYGRVVPVQEVGTSASDQDRVAIRRNRAILAGTLEGAKVLINWLPSV